MGIPRRSVSVLHYPKANFRTADAEHIRAAVLAGLGLAHGPIWAFAPEIASGALHIVLADYAPGPLAISAAHPTGRRVPTKVRVFIDFLIEILMVYPALKGEPGWDSTGPTFPARGHGNTFVSKHLGMSPFPHFNRQADGLLSWRVSGASWRTKVPEERTRGPDATAMGI